jgi:preprotein translocase subunit SecD
VLLIVVVGLATWAFWPGTQHTPRLGLDLQGGTQVILKPVPPKGGGKITEDQLNQTVVILRNRVNGLGVSEAEVAVQGQGSNAVIIVSVPGVNAQQLALQLQQTALMDFRAVLTRTSGGPQTTASPTPSSSPSKSIVPKPSASASASPKKKAAAAATPSATPTPTPTATSQPSPTPTLPPGTKAPVESSTVEGLKTPLLELNCLDPKVRPGGTPDNPDKYIVTCSKDGAQKFALDKAFIRGTEITNATANVSNSGSWTVDLTFNSKGAGELATISTKLSKNPSPQNEFAIVLDGLVQSHPYFAEPILGGQAQISGQFTAQEARDLAQLLKYGALPINLKVQSATTVSPTLGSDQLRAGLLAGAIGLILVVLYLLLYYRAMGLIGVISLGMDALISYILFVDLSKRIGFTLTLAGIAGAIVAIGITADSFVVYFERIRDEIREGKTLRVAVDSGWVRARRTLLAADFVSLLAAVILYLLSVGSVRGFAFALGLTTIVDLVVAFFFTRPLTLIASRSKWFNSDSSLTGVSASMLREGLPQRAATPAGKGK